MEEVIRSAIQNKNYHLIREVLLSVDFFSEIDSLLSEQMQEFYSCIKVVHLTQSHYLDLREGSLYFFLNQGSYLISQNLKELHAKIKPFPSMRKSIRKTQQTLPPISFDKIDAPAESISNIQTWFNQHNRIIKYFFASQGDVTILIIQSKSLPLSLFIKIKQYFVEKFKMISKFHLFKEISKSILQTYISEFQFTKVCFNEYLYSNKKRQDYIFVLQKGQIQIQNTSSQKIIVTAPVLLGDQKIDDYQCAKCMSDYCIAYRLKKSILNQMMKQNFHEFQKDTQKYTKSDESCLRTEYLRQQKYEKPQAKKEDLFLPSSSKYMNGFTKREDRGGKSSALRQYFSNFINEKYDRFFERKAKVVKGITVKEEQPVLYMIKKQIPKIPDYYKMNQKLKAAWIRKTFAFKKEGDRKLCGYKQKYAAERESADGEHMAVMSLIIFPHGKMR